MADKNLTVKIRGDNRGLSQSLSNSRTQVTKFGGFLKKFGSRFGLLGAGFVGTASAAGAIKLFADATGEIDNLAKLGKQFGFSVKEIQVFERVAELTGTNLEQLLKGFGQLTKSIVQFSRDGSGPGAKVFKDLGLSADELTASFKKGPVEVLKVLGTALKKVEDPLKRSAFLEELLGARNKQLAVALNDVIKEFSRAAKELEELDLAISAEEAKSVEDYNDAWTRVGNTLTNVKRKLAIDIAADLEPSVVKLEEALKNFLKGEGDGGSVAQPLGAAVNKGISAMERRLGVGGGLIASTNVLTGPAMAAAQLAKLAGAAFEHGFEGAIDNIQSRVARGLRGAGGMLGFPLTGAALGDLVNPPAPLVPRTGTGTINGRSIADILAAGPAAGQMQRGTPFPGGMAPGTGTINGKSIDGILKESQAQTGLLKGISESFIINERTGARTAVAAP